MTVSNPSRAGQQVRRMVRSGLRIAAVVADVLAVTHPILVPDALTRRGRADFPALAGLDV